MKKTSVIICSAIAILLFTLVLSSCEKKKDGYGQTDDMTITEEEISYFTKRERSNVINEYSQKYSITDYSEFWETEFDGKTPLQTLEERSFNEAIKAKTELKIMKEYGVYEDISYESLKSKAEKYNKEHQNKQGNIGLNSIDMETFYTYYISVGRMEAYNRIQEKEKITDIQISEYREENKISDDLTDEYILKTLAKEKYEKILEETLEDFSRRK